MPAGNMLITTGKRVVATGVVTLKEAEDIIREDMISKSLQRGNYTVSSPYKSHGPNGVKEYEFSRPPTPKRGWKKTIFRG